MMTIYKIQGHSNNASLGVEPYKDRMRIVLLENERELACRKETFSRVLSFTGTDHETIFKGRLRLQTSGNTIAIHFKETLVGFIDKKDFIMAVEKIR